MRAIRLRGPMAGWAVFSVRPSDSMFQPIMQAAVTLIVLGACLYVLLSNGRDTHLKVLGDGRRHYASWLLAQRHVRLQRPWRDTNGSITCPGAT